MGKMKEQLEKVECQDCGVDLTGQNCESDGCNNQAAFCGVCVEKKEWDEIMRDTGEALTEMTCHLDDRPKLSANAVLVALLAAYHGGVNPGALRKETRLSWDDIEKALDELMDSGLLEVFFGHDLEPEVNDKSA